jgi:hypothetical protein
MTKIVVSVGFKFPGNLVEYIPTNSDRSLLDADIIFFQADISDLAQRDSRIDYCETTTDYACDLRYYCSAASHFAHCTMTSQSPHRHVRNDVGKGLII